MLDLVKHRAIPTVLANISENLRAHPDPKANLIIFEIVKLVSCAIQKEYTKAQEYDRVSKIYLDLGIFEFLLEKMPIDQNIELTSFVKTIEFCSNQNSGLQLLYENIEKILKIIDLCFCENKQNIVERVPKFKNIENLYSAATILLDLTANE